MLSVAAVADIHCTEHMRGQLAEALRDVNDRAHVLVLAGDLTASGRLVEAQELLKELRRVAVPIVTVLGNHDYEHGEQDQIHDFLRANGIYVLDGEGFDLDINGERVGFAGTKGFAGGFGRYLLTGYGEEIIKSFVLAGRIEVGKLERALSRLTTARRIVVVHYAPIRDTLEGEPPELYPFLGNSEMCKPIDRFGADVVFHGHSHYGSRVGRTGTGIPVFNVCQALVSTYHLYEIPEAGGSLEGK